MRNTFLKALSCTAAIWLSSMAANAIAWQAPAGLNLNKDNIEAWREHIRPTTPELAWMQIDWLPDLQSGIEEAQETGQPILLWTMNGHPLGCT